MPKKDLLPPSLDAAAPRDTRRMQMADIARLAGVSMSTVSRALNGSSLVNAETRQRVEELARALNYTINLEAKNLRQQRNSRVAVVIPYDRESRQHISDPFFLSMVGSLADALTDRGFDMLLSRVDSENLDSVAQIYDSGSAIGIVLIGQWRHHDQLNQLASRRVPIVVWGGQLPQQLYCSVGGDNVLGGRLATGHLLVGGRRRILFLGDPKLPEVALRHEGYLQALAGAGIAPAPDHLLDVPFDADVAIAALRERQLDFDAVFACSDLLAIATMQTLRERGVAVPEAVAVVGYDDVEIARYCEPPLTTVRQPIALAGIALVEALLAVMAGEAALPRVLPVELVLRRSAGAAA
ncbi:LacI family DNA-binding transcriptional regulator [Derxia lacustris]|uniref:LacI family DNA-binding transcriptional regulator n=1 Tax=Derxia lacustris TaxID=764842 RepID=UPI001F46A126|nr:LacI family DNA-binding transcriptional regulator [Derxia lacustris]